LKNIGLNIGANSLCPLQTALLSYGYGLTFSIKEIVWR